MWERQQRMLGELNNRILAKNDGNLAAFCYGSMEIVETMGEKIK